MQNLRPAPALSHHKRGAALSTLTGSSLTPAQPRLRAAGRKEGSSDASWAASCPRRLTGRPARGRAGPAVPAGSPLPRRVLVCATADLRTAPDMVLKSACLTPP